jgi:radical SAM superfamily enzyme YgiQ (UPF0313 family)
MNQKKVQLVQLNNKYGSQVYLPYSVGILQSYATGDEDIRDNFSFNKFLFVRDKVSSLVKSIGDVDVLGVSCYIWNWSISLKLAERVREKNPNCLIIFGGPQIPNRVGDFFEKYPFIDMVVHGEGEITFQEILKKYTRAGRPDLKNILGTTFYDKQEGEIKVAPPRPRITDLETIPSPYLTGVFDDLFESEDFSWMITWETNRGCPFKCSFCDWGSAIATKIRKFSDERLLEEIDFFSEKKVDLVFGADANFGIFKRDTNFALKLAEKKSETGFPNQFRVCFTKNSTDRVFKLAQIFSNAGMNKGVSISMQSLDKSTLANIQRKNIKMTFFRDLQKKYVENGLVTYTELILPLPGETYQSFVDGIDNLLDSSQHSGIVIYNCSIMPNAEMGSKEYQTKLGLDMVDIPIFQAHSDGAKNDEVVESETIVVGTNSMSRNEYKRTFKFAWILQSMHLLGPLQTIAITLRHHFGIKYSDFYEGFIKYGEKNPQTLIGTELQKIDCLLEGVFEGKSFGQHVPDFEDVLWPAEEATFLRISEELDTFYLEVREYLDNSYCQLSGDKVIDDIMTYQKARLVSFDNQEIKYLTLLYDVHEFFEESRAGMVSQLEEKQNKLKVLPTKTFEDRKIFSREVVWYGRKGGKFFHPIEKV